MAYRKPLLYTAGDLSQQVPVGDRLLIPVLNLGPFGAALTPVANTLTVSSTVHPVTSNNSTVANRRIHTVLGGQISDILILKGAVGSLSIPFLDNTGNLRIAGAFTISNPNDLIVLLYDGTNWIEVTRSANGS